jgi:hypothetical protein
MAPASIPTTTPTADKDPRRRWGGQYPSLWVNAGGGGTFANIWTPNTYAQAGMVVSDTQTPGHVYQISAEHHVRTEFGLTRVPTGNSWRHRPRRKPAKARTPSRSISADPAIS